MKVIAFNGSPRKKWNTAMLIEKALEGAAAKGAETELIHLYDLTYKGCRSCFACKTIGGESYGKCAVKNDDLSPILARLTEYDAIILGSPIYYSNITGEMRSFMERLLFPFRTYTDPPKTLYPKKLKSGFIYTMNVTEEVMKENGFNKNLGIMESIMEEIGGYMETLYCHNTYQFDDYSKIESSRFDPVKKAESRKTVFPIDCQKAYDMGERLAS